MNHCAVRPGPVVRVARLVGPLRRAGADVRAIHAQVHRERRAGLRREDRVRSPASEHGLRHAARPAEEGQLVDAAGDELVRVVEARERPLTGLVEDIPHVLREVGLGFGRPRARGVVLRVGPGIADVVGEVVHQPALGLEGDAVVDGLAVEPDRIDAAQLRNRAARLNRARARLRECCGRSRCRRPASRCPCTTRRASWPG